LVTGIADAQIDSTPMVCITGQVGKHLLGSDAFQETILLGFQLQYQMELPNYKL
jgi:acetolactate synthase-1/2/3 large subunit